MKDICAITVIMSPHFSKKFVVSAGISWNAKAVIYCIDTKTTKVNSSRYIKLLDEELLLDSCRFYLSKGFVFQWVRATSHTTYTTPSSLKDKYSKDH